MDMNEIFEKALIKIESMSDMDFCIDLLRFKYIGTEHTQLLSLINFAIEIGYLWEENGTFSWMGISPTSRKVVSFRTMVSYHNKELEYQGLWDIVNNPKNMPLFSERTNLTETMRVNACNAKLVDEVKLQWSKKEGKIIVQSNKVCLKKEVV